MNINSAGENIIFIISQPRAGSTLLQRILSGHSKIHSTSEPWLLLHPIYALRENGHTAEYNSVLAYTATNNFLNTLDEGVTAYYEAIRSFAIELYLRACKQSGKQYFIDKTPRYYYIIPEINHIFPKANFIFLLRNPLAVLASILNTNVKGHWPLLARYKNDLIFAPMRILEGIDHTDTQNLVLHYEKLVQTPEEVIQNTCNFIGINYEKGMLDYGSHGQLDSRMGDQTEINKHNRPVMDPMDRWINLTKNAQTRHFFIEYLKELGPDLLKRLGYSYTDLFETIDSTTCEEGKVSFTWKQLIYPDEKMQKRLVLVELAQLQHRRIVHTIKSWGRKLH